MGGINSNAYVAVAIESISYMLASENCVDLTK